MIVDGFVFELNVFRPGQGLVQQDWGDGTFSVPVVGDGCPNVEDVPGKLEVVLGDHSQGVQDQVGEFGLLVGWAALVGVNSVQSGVAAKAKDGLNYITIPGFIQGCETPLMAAAGG